MKLTYWVAVPLYYFRLGEQDTHCIRTKTKQECYQVLEMVSEYWIESYEKPKKVTVEYSDGFDLMMQCSGDQCHSWEGELKSKKDTTEISKG